MRKEDSVKCVVLVLVAGSDVLRLGLARSCNNGLACITDRLVFANRLTMESNKPRPISIFFHLSVFFNFCPDTRQVRMALLIAGTTATCLEY